jgi:hypothetical protein
MLEMTAEVDSSLYHHALGLIVRVEGNWDESSLAQFSAFLSQRELRLTDVELKSVLDHVRNRYFELPNELYLCAEHPCCDGIANDLSEADLAHTVDAAGLKLCKTGCQGICKHSPVASLRIGARSKTFTQIVTEDDWHTVLRFSAKAESLLISDPDAERLFRDPVHDHDRLDTHLEPLKFLLGHFHGEGQHTTNQYAFEKRVICTYEAGGRFIGLRMDASYPMADGHNDVHRALVIVGVQPSSGNIVGHAYTDGGMTLEYDVVHDGNRLKFADASPDHSHHWKRARKILEPSSDSYEERLEVDGGNGFQTYYTIHMRKISERI